MIEGLIWLFASVGSGIAVMFAIPKVVMSTGDAWRKRNVEKPTKEPPSMVCPMDAGTWGPWSAIYEERRVNDPTYPSISGHHIVRSQTRQCQDCGYGERRVL